jgi:phosphatidylglycerophosphatase A
VFPQFKTPLSVKTSLATIIASGLGSGLSPISPGTIGSIAACIAWALLPSLNVQQEIAATVLLGVIGYAASLFVMRNASTHADPQWIVIDEWCGMWIALTCCPDRTLSWVAVAFVLFRFFDISKIGPVGWAERAPGALGVMLDDVVAGVCAGGVIGLIRLVMR